MKTAAYWIEKLELEKHPEGGYFREIYLSDDIVPQTGLPAISAENAVFPLLFIICSKATIFQLFTVLSPMKFGITMPAVLPSKSFRWKKES